MSILLFAIITSSIIGLFAYSLVILIKNKQIPITPNLLQPILFCGLYYLIYLYLGPQYYQFDHEPELWDWIQFTFAHMLRATDILDFIEEYKFDIQNIKHDSILVANILWIMHWIMDVFLLGLLWRLISNYWESKYLQFFTSNRLLIGLTILILIVLLSTLILQAQAENKDLWWIGLNFILLWPLDNIIRVIDAGDGFQLYGIRLHQLDMNLWTASLAIAFRLILSVPLARMLNILIYGTLGHILKTVDDLIDDLGDSEIADHAIDALILVEKTATPKLLCKLNNINVEVQKGVIRCLRRLDENIIRSSFNSLKTKEQLATIDGLIKSLNSSDEIAQEQAAKTLGFLRIKAQAAIPALIQILGEYNFDVRIAAAQALNDIDAEWVKNQGVGTGLFELAKTLIVQNTYNQKIIPKIQSRMTAEVQSIANNLMQAIINAGVTFTEKEAKFTKIGLAVALAKPEKANQQELIKYLERDNANAMVKSLAQLLTDVEVKKRERRELIEKERELRQQQSAKREQLKEQAEQWLPILKPLFVAWIMWQMNFFLAETLDPVIFVFFRTWVIIIISIILIGKWVYRM